MALPGFQPQANDPRAGQLSSLLNSLPAIFQQAPAGLPSGAPNPLGRYLMAFESLLLGLPKTNTVQWRDLQQPGLEEIIGGAKDRVTGNPLLVGIERYFDPDPALDDSDLALNDPALNSQNYPTIDPGVAGNWPRDHRRAPAAFLPWLASWVGLALREDWDESYKRSFIARAAQLYRLRGTKTGMQQFISLYTRMPVQIDEFPGEFQIGIRSRINVDTRLEGGWPFFFQVSSTLLTPDPMQLKQAQQVTAAIIDAQKPAHTTYVLQLQTPQLQVAVRSTVSVDTLLGLSGTQAGATQ